MSYFITNYCFFTGKVVVSTTPPGKAVLDGYYYTIWYHGRECAIRLFCDDNWSSDLWVQQHGKDFIKMIDVLSSWSFFDMPKDLATVQFQYEKMKGLLKQLSAQAIQKKEHLPDIKIKVA